MAGLVVPNFESDRSPAIQREQLRSFMLTASTATVGGSVLGGALAMGPVSYTHLTLPTNREV